MTTNDNNHTNREWTDETKDPKFDFALKRALLEDTPTPDVDRAFAQFKHKNSPHSHKRAYIVSLSGLLAAACIIGFIFFAGHKRLTPNPANDHLSDLGNIVYEAQPQRQYISVSFGGKAIALDPKTGAQDEGIILNDRNEIQVFGVPADNHDEATLTVPQGKQAKIMLDDGTVIWMNADSHITFPRHFYENGPREITLKGEACFEVTHDESRPFIVNCDGFTTTVLGTKFDIRSYNGEQPKVTLINGSVSVKTRREEAILHPEQTATLNTDGETDIASADLEVVTSWMNNTFYFDGQELREILLEIGRWYNVSVVFATNKHLGEKLHFNTERNKSLNDVIRQLQMISTAKFKLTDKALIVE